MKLLGSLFRKPAPADDEHESWWRLANRIALAPTGSAIDELRASLTSAGDVDEIDRREEMIAGLMRLMELGARETLPQIETQHRVIGADRCHFAAPADLGGDQDAPGKVFVTSSRLVFAGPAVSSWRWHRIREIARIERDL